MDFDNLVIPFAIFYKLFYVCGIIEKQSNKLYKAETITLKMKRGILAKLVLQN